MKSWKTLSFVLLGVVLFLSVVVLRISYFGEPATGLPILVDVEPTVAKTLATAQTETKAENLPTSADVQTDTEATDVQTDTEATDVQTDTEATDVQTDTEATDVQTDTEATDVQTDTEATDVQTDTKATEAPTTPKPVTVNPAVELTLLRHTSVGQVRAG